MARVGALATGAAGALTSTAITVLMLSSLGGWVTGAFYASGASAASARPGAHLPRGLPSGTSGVQWLASSRSREAPCESSKKH